MSRQTFVISRNEKGNTVAAVLRGRLRLSWSQVRRLIREGCVRLGGSPCVDPTRPVRAGQRLEVQGAAGPGSPARRERRQTAKARLRGPAPVIRFADAHLVVVDKPAGLTTVRHRHEEAEFGARARRFLPPTLADVLPDLLTAGPGRQVARVRAVHRLDKETSGLVVFALTAEAERQLGRQFRAHTIERCYLAVVRGRARPGRIESRFVDDRGDGRRGSTAAPGAGKTAVTNVRVVEPLGDFTLVECRLETGRTHQVRIHLGEQGTPVCGERVYDRPPHGQPAPDASGAPRLALHAATLGFVHPTTGKRLSWKSALPEDLARLVARLRKEAHTHGGREKGTPPGGPATE